MKKLSICFLILFSALSTPGITSIEEEKISRNHTEIFLKKIGKKQFNIFRVI